MNDMEYDSDDSGNLRNLFERQTRPPNSDSEISNFSGFTDPEIDNNQSDNEEIELENQEPPRPRQIPIGNNVIVLEYEEISVSFSRVDFKRNWKFHLSDFHFRMRIDFKQNQDNIVLQDFLPLLANGIVGVIDYIKTYFQDLNRLVFIKFAQNGLRPAIKIPVSHLQNESSEEIANKVISRLSAVLESHSGMKADASINIFFIVLGSEHMDAIDRIRRNAYRNADIPTSGGANEKRVKYLITIPVALYPESDQLCLPLSIILASFIEYGAILGNINFNSGVTMSKMASKNIELQKKACASLKNEFEKLTKKYPQMIQKQYTFNTICPLLAKHFKINIVIHQLGKSGKSGRDEYCHLESGSMGNKFDVSQPRIGKSNF